MKIRHSMSHKPLGQAVCVHVCAHTRPEGREPLADREGKSTLLSQSGEEKGLRWEGLGARGEGDDRG